MKTHNDVKEGQLTRLLRELDDTGAARPFQRLWNNILGSSAYMWNATDQDDREKSKKLDLGRYEILILRNREMAMPHHGQMEMAVIINKETDEYVVLSGEIMKHGFDRGVIGFRINEEAFNKKAQAEITGDDNKLIHGCVERIKYMTKAVENIIAEKVRRFGGRWSFKQHDAVGQWHDLRDALGGLFVNVDFADKAERYLRDTLHGHIVPQSGPKRPVHVGAKPGQGRAKSND